MRYIVLFIFFTLNNILIYGQEIQNSSNIWYFGNMAGLNFNNTPPTALTNGQLNTQEGVATISNNLGELLFYSDGITVWDRNHQHMPNANGTLNGSFSSTQSAMITPHPGDSNLYYLFTTDELAGAKGLSYSIVDISLPGNGSPGLPLGDLVSNQLNIQLASPIAEKIVGFKNSKQDGYWVVVHGWNNSLFYAYEISCDGIDPNPVISDIGNVHSGGNNNINAVGYMKSTINGQKLALVNRNNNSIDIYDFDNSSGTVSNEVEIKPNDNLLYGIEFSPSGDYLFIGGRDNISRYSLNSGTLINIPIDNNIPFSGNNAVRALQLGPDKNIYVSINNWEYISIIFDPDGQNPGLTTNGIYLNLDNIGRKCRFGLPNIFYSDFFPNDSITIKTCPSVPIQYNGETYQPGSINEIHLVSSTGCDSTLILEVEEYDISEQTQQFSSCEGSFYEFNGVQIPAGSQEVFIFTDSNGCDSIINVIVDIVDIINEDIVEELCRGEIYTYNGEEYPVGTDTIIQFVDQTGCKNVVSILLLASPELEFELSKEDACWNMDNGSIALGNINGGVPPFIFTLDNQTFFTDTVLNTLPPGIYNLHIIDSNQCSFYHEFEITSIPEFSIDFPEILFPCEEDSIILDINLIGIDEDEVRWNWFNGSKSHYTYVSHPGSYSLEVSNKCQVLSETINVALEDPSGDGLVYIPNAFSPNSDGINDFFQLYHSENTKILNLEIQIFNRWGGQVFRSEDISFSWDGVFNEKELNPGLYVWWLKLGLLSCKKERSIFMKGDVTIIR